MKQIIYPLSLFFIVSSFNISFPQLNIHLDDNDLEKLSRFRISFGYVNLLAEDDNFSF